MIARTRASRLSRWDVASADADAVAAVAAGTGLSEITARILVARGIATPDEVRRFLTPSMERDWVEAGDIPGMVAAAARVAAAVRGGERIVVFGDFDLDGISAAAAATLGLRAMGATVEAAVPHRFREGYGLSLPAMERIAEMDPNLVVTVDCGISSATEVAWLKDHGIDVVVTDHHEPAGGVPGDVPVANPKLMADGPALSGAGVVLALVRAVGDVLGAP